MCTSVMLFDDEMTNEPSADEVAAAPEEDEEFEGDEDEEGEEDEDEFDDEDEE